jgi:hypothetical protein
MSIELARARLRGIYAVVAGALLVVVVPFFEGSILASTGYITAVNHISGQHDFGPYLVWVEANQDTDIIFHAVQFLIFLAAFTLPATLVDVLWHTPTRASRLARITGQIGFGCYALAILVGLLVTGNSAGAYAGAATAGARAAVADHFASLFAFLNILSHILGGVLVAIALMIFSARIMRREQRALPGWLGYLGVLVAALLVVTALQFAALPATPDTSISPIAFVALAIWLICLGIYMAQVATLPGVRAEPGAPADQDGDHVGSANAAIPDTGAMSDSSHQRDAQSEPEETSR